MYSPAAIEKAPAASPASPASSTALLSSAPPRDAGDQGEVRHQPVRGAEHGRPQPAAGDVGVLVRDALGLALGALLGRRSVTRSSSSTSSSRAACALVGALGGSSAGAWSRRRASSSSGVSRPGRSRALTTK